MEIDSSMLKQLLAAKSISLLSDNDSEDGTVLIKDRRIIGYIDINNVDTPSLTDYIWGIQINQQGKVTHVLRFTAQQLIDKFGEEATEAANSAIQTKEDIDEIKTAIDAIKSQIDEALQQFTLDVSAAEDAIDDKKDQVIAAIDTELEDKTRVGYRTVIGDGTTKSFDIVHNMGSDWTLISVSFKDIAKGYYYKAYDKDSNTLHIDFDYAPEANGVEVKIIPNVRIETPVMKLPDDYVLEKENIPDMGLTTEQMSEILAILQG